MIASAIDISLVGPSGSRSDPTVQTCDAGVCTCPQSAPHFCSATDLCVADELACCLSDPATDTGAERDACCHTAVAGEFYCESLGTCTATEDACCTDSACCAVEAPPDTDDYCDNHCVNCCTDVKDGDVLVSLVADDFDRLGEKSFLRRHFQYLMAMVS